MKGLELQFRTIEQPVGVTVVELVGELDYAQVKNNEAIWREKVCQTQDKYIVIDCLKLKYMDSTGLALLLEAVIARGEEKPTHFLIDRNAYIYQVVEITGAAKIMSIYQNIQSSIEKLKNSAG